MATARLLASMPRAAIRCAGLTLPEMLVVLAILGSLTAWQLHRKAQELHLRQATLAAARLAQYHNAVADWFLHHDGTPPAGDRTGTSWLKDRVGCAGGGAEQAWLPCSFPDFLPFGLRYATTVDTRGGTAQATTRLGKAQVGGKDRLDLAAEIVSQALGKTDLTVNGNHEILLSPDDQTIVARFATRGSADGKEAFLRVDGGNRMQADLDTGGFRLKQVQSLDFRYGNDRKEEFNVRMQNTEDGKMVVSNHAGASVELFGLRGQTVRDVRIVAQGTRVAKPDCGKDLNPQIFIVPSGFLGTRERDRRLMIAGVRAWAEEQGNAWIARFQVLSEGQQWLSSDTSLLVVTKCSA